MSLPLKIVVPASTGVMGSRGLSAARENRVSMSRIVNGGGSTDGWATGGSGNSDTTNQSPRESSIVTPRSFSAVNVAKVFDLALRRNARAKLLVEIFAQQYRRSPVS